jgi:CubicO group peptidase (beta-lactamase class C family)
MCKNLERGQFQHTILGWKQASLVLIGLSFFAAAGGDDSLSAFTAVALEQLADTHRVCVVAVATLRRGAVTAIHSSRCDSNQSPSEPVVFQAASLGKPVFAYGVLKLVQDGKLNLDAPLSDYLPNGYLHLHDPFDPKQSNANDLLPANVLRDLTARQVLTHTSGLPNWAGGPLTVEFPPGSAWQYSGEGYYLLQKAIESESGTEFDAFMHAEVFEPLAMVDSSYIWSDRYASRFAYGSSSNGEEDGHRQFLSAVSAATLYTTADDYATFLETVLGAQHAMQVISGSAVEVVPELGFAWGLGWGLWQGDNERFIWHWGDNPGFKAFTIASLQTGDGVVILTNSDDGLALAESIVDTVLPQATGVFKFYILRSGLHRMVCRKFGWCF